METFKEYVGWGVLLLLMMVGLGALFAGVEMWLWNQVMPDLFGFKELSFWQALCISWLSMLLIKGVSPSSNKGEDQLKEIVGLQRRQEDLLTQMVDFQDRQVNALAEIKDSLQDIGSILERQR
jgi:hypothetical protein